MSMLNFTFYPPKKQQDISLVPNSSIVGVSALMPKSKAARKKKADSLKRKGCEFIPPFGPTQATAMSSDVSGNPTPITGYGNTNYGARAYGEAINKHKSNSFAIYNTDINICNLID